jgi:hypothetical protein
VLRLARRDARRCNRCGLRFERTSLAGDGYGQLIGQTPGGEEVEFNSWEDAQVFDEVSALVRSILDQEGRVLPGAFWARCFKRVLGTACDPSPMGWRYLFLGPMGCPACGSEHVVRDGASSDAYSDVHVPQVTHREWSVLELDSQRQLLREALRRAGCLRREPLSVAGDTLGVPAAERLRTFCEDRLGYDGTLLRVTAELDRPPGERTGRLAQIDDWQRLFAFLQESALPVVYLDGGQRTALPAPELIIDRPDCSDGVVIVDSEGLALEPQVGWSRKIWFTLDPRRVDGAPALLRLLEWVRALGAALTADVDVQPEPLWALPLVVYWRDRDLFEVH